MRINILKCLDRGQIADMIYIANNGEISKRRVKVLSVDDTTFEAHCFKRKAKRMFKIENVLAFVPVTHNERNVI